MTFRNADQAAYDCVKRVNVSWQQAGNITLLI
jgi:hypothetical protein